MISTDATVDVDTTNIHLSASAVVGHQTPVIGLAYAADGKHALRGLFYHDRFADDINFLLRSVINDNRRLVI